MTEPDYGVILDDALFYDGARIPAGTFIRPRLEVELLEDFYAPRPDNLGKHASLLVPNGHSSVISCRRQRFGDLCDHSSQSRSRAGLSLVKPECV